MSISIGQQIACPDYNYIQKDCGSIAGGKGHGALGIHIQQIRTSGRVGTVFLELFLWGDITVTGSFGYISNTYNAQMSIRGSTTINESLPRVTLTVQKNKWTKYYEKTFNVNYDSNGSAYVSISVGRIGAPPGSDLDGVSIHGAYTFHLENIGEAKYSPPSSVTMSSYIYNLDQEQNRTLSWSDSPGVFGLNRYEVAIFDTNYNQVSQIWTNATYSNKMGFQRMYYPSECFDSNQHGEAYIGVRAKSSNGYKASNWSYTSLIILHGQYSITWNALVDDKKTNSLTGLFQVTLQYSGGTKSSFDSFEVTAEEGTSFSFTPKINPNSQSYIYLGLSEGSGTLKHNVNCIFYVHRIIDIFFDKNNEYAQYVQEISCEYGKYFNFPLPPKCDPKKTEVITSFDYQLPGLELKYPTSQISHVEETIQFQTWKDKHTSNEYYPGASKQATGFQQTPDWVAPFEEYCALWSEQPDKEVEQIFYNNLPVPSYDGYKFLGWFLDKEGNIAVPEIYMPEVDNTIYACWEILGNPIFIYSQEGGWKQYLPKIYHDGSWHDAIGKLRFSNSWDE